MIITPTSFDELLSNLGTTLGMELSFDGDACELLLDGRWTLNIARVPEEGRIVLSSVVLDSLPEEISYTALTDMLGYALNPLSGTGPALGLDPESDTLIAYVSIHLSRFEPGEFPGIIAKFMEFVIGQADRIGEEQTDADLNSIDLTASSDTLQV